MLHSVNIWRFQTLTNWGGKQDLTGGNVLEPRSPLERPPLRCRQQTRADALRWEEHENHRLSRGRDRSVFWLVQCERRLVLH